MSILSALKARLGIKLDGHGGILPTSLRRAKNVDLVTFGPGVKAAHCGNCVYFKNRYCDNEQVKMAVNEHQCCSLWDRPGTFRAWQQ